MKEKPPSFADKLIMGYESTRKSGKTLKVLGLSRLEKEFVWECVKFEIYARYQSIDTK